MQERGGAPGAVVCTPVQATEGRGHAPSSVTTAPIPGALTLFQAHQHEASMAVAARRVNCAVNDLVVVQFEKWWHGRLACATVKLNQRLLCAGKTPAHHSVRESSYDGPVPVPASDSVPTVLLRHDVPNEASHFDWMIATDTAGQGPLMTFRLSTRVDELQAGEVLNAERLPDHRSAYLDYEGPISGGRGSVKRVAQGRARVVAREDKLILDVSWVQDERIGLAQVLELVPWEGTEWIVECQRRVIEDRSQ